MMNYYCDTDKILQNTDFVIEICYNKYFSCKKSIIFKEKRTF